MEGIIAITALVILVICTGVIVHSVWDPEDTDPDRFARYETACFILVITMIIFLIFG